MKTKPILGYIMILALGFGAGWLSRRGTFAPITQAPAGAKDSAVPGKTAAALEPKPANPGAIREIRPVGVQERSLIANLNSLAWEKKQGAQVSVDVFAGEKLNPRFASVFNLSPGDVATINKAIADARGRLDAIAIQTAKFQTSPDGSRLTVEVPSTTEQGGAIHDALLQTIQGVLGPGRFESFDDVSGDSFESGFNSFGLSNVRYELAPAGQNTASGEPLYTVVKASTGTGAYVRSTYSSIVQLNQVGGLFPVLGHFIPAGYGTQPGPN